MGNDDQADQGKNPKKNPEQDPKKKPEGPVKTQMVGESPGDDLGYDPETIPTEKIPDDE